MTAKNAVVGASVGLMRYDERATDARMPAQRGAFTEAEERISKARGRVWELISELNERADAVFGSSPTPMEGGKIADPPHGALAMLFVAIDELERAVPSLERAIERFANLA